MAIEADHSWLYSHSSELMPSTYVLTSFTVTSCPVVSPPRWSNITSPLRTDTANTLRHHHTIIASVAGAVLFSPAGMLSILHWLDPVVVTRGSVVLRTLRWWLSTCVCLCVWMVLWVTHWWVGLAASASVQLYPVWSGQVVGCARGRWMPLLTPRSTCGGRQLHTASALGCCGRTGLDIGGHSAGTCLSGVVACWSSY